MRRAKTGIQSSFRIFSLVTGPSSVHFKPEPKLPREVVDGADLLDRGMGNVGHRHGKLAGEQHGGKSFSHFAVHLFGDCATRGTLLALTAMQSRAHLAHQTLHSCNGEV